MNGKAMGEKLYSLNEVVNHLGENQEVLRHVLVEPVAPSRAWTCCMPRVPCV